MYDTFCDYRWLEHKFYAHFDNFMQLQTLSQSVGHSVSLPINQVNIYFLSISDGQAT